MRQRTKGGDKSGSSLYIPDFYADTVVDIDFAHLHDLGIRHIFLDLDQTLRRAYSRELEQDIIHFFAELKTKGWFETISLLSNNNRNLRRYSEPLQARVFQPFWRRGRMIRKPHPLFFERAIRELGIPADQTAMIGDKIRLDIAGGNRTGLTTVLVNPRGRDYWFDQVIFARYRERRALRAALLEHQSHDITKPPAE